jgi:hypothetical protein
MSEIVVGTRVFSALYGGRHGIVYRITGTPGADSSRNVGGVIISGGSSTYFDIVFEDGSRAMKLPESIITGVQWRILDEPIASSAEIEKALDYSNAEEERRAREKAAAKEAFDAEVERLKTDPEWSYLQQSSAEKPMRGAKLAAKNIRKFLKKKFPGVKFSVRLEGYDCVWVTWPKEQSSDEVEQSNLRDVLGFFKTGYYDFESDCHLSKDSPFNVVFGGTQYFIIQPQY